MHETLKRDDDVQIGSEKSFGLVFAVVFVIIAVRLEQVHFTRIPYLFVRFMNNTSHIILMIFIRSVHVKEFQPDYLLNHTHLMKPKIE